MSTSRKPVHPGQFLREEFLEVHGITQEKFAQALNLNRVTVNKLLNQKQGITPDVAIRLSVCLETTPDVWLNMQQKVDIWEEQHNSKHVHSRKRVKTLRTLSISA